MIKFKPAAIGVLSWCMLCSLGNSLQAQVTQTEVDQAELKQKLAEAKAATAKAQAEQITNLGLPKFESKTTLKEGAGEIEASLMATVAIRSAVKQISSDLGLQDSSKQSEMVVAPGSMNLSTWQLFLVSNQLDREQQKIVDGCKAFVPQIGSCSQKPDVANFVAGTAVAAFNAIGGLLGVETTVTALKLDGLDDKFIALALKAEKPALWLASANDYAPENLEGMCKTEPQRIFCKYTAFLDLMNIVRDEINDRQTAKASPRTGKARKKILEVEIGKLQKLIDAASTFQTKIEAIDDKGSSLLIRSLITDHATSGREKLLNLHVIKIGGSAVETKHIGTMFGDDPLRISAGLILGWTLEDKTNPKLQRAGYVMCWTAPKSFRRIQKGKWLRDGFGGKNGPGGDRCRSVSLAPTATNDGVSAVTPQVVPRRIYQDEAVEIRDSKNGATNRDQNVTKRNLRPRLEYGIILESILYKNVTYSSEDQHGHGQRLALLDD